MAAPRRLLAPLLLLLLLLGLVLAAPGESRTPAGTPRRQRGVKGGSEERENRGDRAGVAAGRGARGNRHPARTAGIRRRWAGERQSAFFGAKTLPVPVQSGSVRSRGDSPGHRRVPQPDPRGAPPAKRARGAAGTAAAAKASPPGTRGSGTWKRSGSKASRPGAAGPRGNGTTGAPAPGPLAKAPDGKGAQGGLARRLVRPRGARRGPGPRPGGWRRTRRPRPRLSHKGPMPF